LLRSCVHSLEPRDSGIPQSLSSNHCPRAKAEMKGLIGVNFRAECPHSVFVCFVWISEQTAIISLYSINWLVFVTETECVYCAVRAEWFNVIQLQLGLLIFPPHFSFPCHYHFSIAPHSSSSTRRSDQEKKGQSLGTYQK
jgi:hypothetical protein